MSSNPQRRPSRTAPRPPRPSLPPNLERCETARSSSPTLSNHSDSQQSLPEYNGVHRTGSSPQEVRRHRRGSDGDSHPRYAAPSQRKRSQTVRSKSTKQRSRPQITIVSASPMSHHPAFADGAKGSYIPPEAPPSYDEAMKDPLPQNPLFTQPPIPDHLPHQRRVFPTVETALPYESETTPKSLWDHQPSEEPTVSDCIPTEQLVVELPVIDDSHPTTAASSQSNPYINGVHSTEEERHPVPTPRTKRKVSLHRNTPPSSTELASTSSTRTTPTRPPIPPKKPQLKSPSLPLQHSETSSSQPQPSDLLTLVENPDLPSPMLPRKLPPPPRPPNAHKQTIETKLVESSVEDAAGTNENAVPVAPSMSPPHVMDEDKDICETSSSSTDKAASTAEEPVYAKVRRNTNPKPAKRTSPKQTDLKHEENVEVEVKPPEIPSSRPPMEDYEGILFDVDNREKSHDKKESPELIRKDTISSQQSPKHLSPSSSIDSLYESVRFHKNLEGSKSHRQKPVKPSHEAPRTPGNPPPLPASRPVGNQHKIPPSGGRRLSSGDVPKREKEKNGVKMIRRKSAHFKEKGLKLFRQRTSSEEGEKINNPEPMKTVHENSPKVKKVPPPRPALPPSLQRKTSAVGYSSATNISQSSSELPSEDEVSNTVSNGTTTEIVVKQEKTASAKPSRPARPAPHRPPALKPLVTNSNVPPLPKPRHNARNLVKETKPVEPTQSLIDFEECDNIDGLVVDVSDEDTSLSLIEMTPPLSPSPVPSPPNSAKLKPARPPPAMLPSPLLPLHNKHKKPEHPTKDLEEIQPQVDEQMKSYVDGEEFYIAVKNYHPTNFTDLSFSAGEKISVMKRIDDSTLFGRNEEGEEGPFPEKFVKLETEECGQQNSNSNNNNNNSNKNSIDIERVVALFSYSSTNPEDLAFSSGDVIQVVEIISPDWMKGSLDGRSGIFPTNFVDVASKNQVNAQKVPKRKIYGTALYNFSGINSNELEFQTGDKIEILGRVNEEWLNGRHGDDVGMFPSSYVRTDIPPKPGGGLPRPLIKNISRSKGEFILPGPKTQVDENQCPENAVALFDFTGKDSTELTFQTDDVITITKKVNNDWFEGELNGQTGIFPSNFVQL